MSDESRLLLMSISFVTGIENCTEELLQRSQRKEQEYYEYYSLGGTREVPADYAEISFVCLRTEGCLEPPATVETVWRTACKKLTK